MVIVEGRRGDTIMSGGNPFLKFEPNLFFQPQTLEELQLILKEARLQVKSVKAAGTYSSSNQMAFTSGFAISMEKFNKLIEINVRTKTVTVEAGMTLSQLSTIINQYDMALPVLPLRDGTIGGAVSAGCVGMATKSGCISSHVLEFELLLGDGMVVTCNQETDPQLFNMASISLGAFGIILSIKLQCIQSYTISLSTKMVSLNLMLNRLFNDNINQLSSICYDLSSKKCIIRNAQKINESQDKISIQSKSLLTFTMASYLWVYCCQILCIVGYILPFLANIFTRLIFVFIWSTFPPTTTIKSQDLQHFKLCLGTWPTNATEICEWALPRDKVGEFLNRLRTRIEETNMKIHGTVCLRFCRSDQLPMSVAYKMDAVLLTFTFVRSKLIRQSILDEYHTLITELCCSVSARPNWTKPHNVKANYFSTIYEKTSLYLKIRHQLDPSKTFLNNYIRQRFNTQQRDSDNGTQPKVAKRLFKNTND